MKKITFTIAVIFIAMSAFGQGEWNWSNHLSSSGDLYPSGNILTDIQVDDDNNIYHCGAYDASSLDLQGSSLSNEGRWDAFVCKYSPNGTLQWINRMYSTHNDEAASMVVIDGYVYVVGDFRNEDIYFTPSFFLPNEGDWDTYLAKYDLDGNFLKATKLFGGSGSQRVKDMTYNPYTKDLIVTGLYKDQIIYNDGVTPLVTVNTIASGKEFYFAEIDTAGVVNGFSRAYTMQTNNSSQIKDVNMSPDSSYYFTGDLYDTLIFPGTTNDTIIGDASTSTALIFKMDKNLNLSWLRTGGGTGYDHANSAASDQYGNVYVSGKVEGTIKFDSTETLQTVDITGRSSTDFFICKYNQKGNLIWLKRKGGDGADNAYGLDVYNNLVQFCGIYADTLIINADTLTSSSTTDINTGFAIFDVDGNEIGGQSIGGSDNNDYGRAIRFDKAGHTLISGYFTSSSVKIGDSTYTNNSNTGSGYSRDAFIAAYYYPFNVTLAQTEQILCASDSTAELVGSMYFGNGNYSYEWSPNVVDFVDSVAFNLPAGTYTLTVRDGNDSVAFASYTITEPSLINVELDSTNLTCYQAGDGTITTSVTGGTGAYSFEWVGASGYNPTDQNQSNIGVGWYQVTVSDENNCEVRDSIEIIQPDKIKSTATVTPESPGGNDGTLNISVTGGTTPYNYSWKLEGASIPGNTNNLINLEEGLYTANITDDNSCPYDTNIVVPGVNLRVVLNGTDISCANAGDGLLSASIASGYDATKTYTYEFFDSTKTSLGDSSEVSTFSDLGKGWYFVKLTESETNETDMDSVLIDEPDSIKIAFNPMDAECAGGNTSIGTVITGGVPDFTFLWSDGSSTQSIAGKPAGEYKLTVTDANSCSVTDSSETKQPPALLVNIVENQPISCFGSINGQLDAIVSGGTTPYTYKWNDNGRQDTYFARLLADGVYEVEVEDSMNCTVVKSYKLSEPPMLQLADMDTSNLSCTNTNDGFFKVYITGGTPPYNYNWPLYPSNDSSSAANLPPFEAPISVEVSDSRGCGDSIYSFLVNNPPSPLTVSEDVDAHIDNACHGSKAGTLGISASGGWGAYEYSVNVIDWQSSPIFTDLDARIYTISVRDIENCVKTVDVTIDEPNDLAFVTEQSVGASLSVSATGGTEPYEYSLDKFEWQNASVFEGLANGEYKIYIRDANQCGPDSSGALLVSTNITNTLANSGISLFPNPSDGLVTLQLATLSVEELKIELFSLTGARVYSSNERVAPVSDHNILLDLSTLDRGVYLMKINNVPLQQKIVLE